MPGCLQVLVSLSTVKFPIAGQPLLKVALAFRAQLTSSNSVAEGFTQTVEANALSNAETQSDLYNVVVALDQLNGVLIFFKPDNLTLSIVVIASLKLLDALAKEK